MTNPNAFPFSIEQLRCSFILICIRFRFVFAWKRIAFHFVLRRVGHVLQSIRCIASFYRSCSHTKQHQVALFVFVSVNYVWEGCVDVSLFHFIRHSRDNHIGSLCVAFPTVYTLWSHGMIIHSSTSTQTQLAQHAQKTNPLGPREIALGVMPKPHLHSHPIVSTDSATFITFTLLHYSFV